MLSVGRVYITIPLCCPRNIRPVNYINCPSVIILEHPFFLGPVMKMMMIVMMGGGDLMMMMVIIIFKGPHLFWVSNNNNNDDNNDNNHITLIN